MTQQYGLRRLLPDTYLSGKEDSRQIIIDAIDRVTDELANGLDEIDWTTLDLRVFRDVSGDPLRHDDFLTVRASALTRMETP